MLPLSSLMPKYTQQKPDKTLPWQTQALECIAKLVDGTKYKGSIFKCFKTDPRTAQFALEDSIELSKPYAKYFFATYSAIRTRTNDPSQREPTKVKENS